MWIRSIDIEKLAYKKNQEAHSNLKDRLCMSRSLYLHILQIKCLEKSWKDIKSKGFCPRLQTYWSKRFEDRTKTKRWVRTECVDTTTKKHTRPRQKRKPEGEEATHLHLPVILTGQPVSGLEPLVRLVQTQRDKATHTEQRSKVRDPLLSKGRLERQV